MIPAPLRFSAQFYLLAACVAAAFFFGSTCGQRSEQGDALRQHTADSVRYVQTRDSLMREVLDAETARIHAERKADSLAAFSMQIAADMQRKAPPRIHIVPRDTSDMVDVCVVDDGCYPSHRKVAAIAATLDSLVHHEVPKLVAAFDTERQAWKDALRAANVERNLEREARRAAEARIAQLERTVAALRPSKWDRAKPSVFGVAGIVLGGMVAR